MRYINTKTGAVIETASVISGGDWISEETEILTDEVPDDSQVLEMTKSEKPKTTGKKG